MNIGKESKREIWLDNVKVVACILVVCGHFFQSMVKAGILNENDLYRWFDQTIYLFHVPLFFICSGYFYQKYSKVNSFSTWRRNICKKLIVLGIPYFTFSTITVVLKIIFSNSVNNQASGLLNTLFVSPASPYWYLYSLFFIFFVTPTFSRKTFAYFSICIALLFKIYAIVMGGSSVYAISTIFKNEIWFVFGMYLWVIDFKSILERCNSLYLGVLLLIVFLGLSVVIFLYKISNGIVDFMVGIIACLAILMIMSGCKKSKLSKCRINMAQYTFPIFLMHTIFAAPTRIVLLKVGIQNIFLHILFGLAASIIGPIIAAKVMIKFKMLEIFLYPGKYIKINI